MDSNNTSNDSNDTGSASRACQSARESAGKRQQFTSKQRMDMYAFCVLELEMHSNKVSIKKQQQAIQKVLNEQQRGQQQQTPNESHQKINDSYRNLSTQNQPDANQPNVSRNGNCTNHNTFNDNGHEASNQNSTIEENGTEGKTLLELQQRLAIDRKCYSDYQKTQVLTSSMLRDVQKRFARYYPGSAIPSRTTIKHVFAKCVAHGTVENIKTPRKSTKITQGDEIEQLLIHKPHLSLRQLAQKLNVSTGTVSRRCKALGLIPYSVTIKHQQLATARRQRQIKQLEDESKELTIPSSSDKSS